MLTGIPGERIKPGFTVIQMPATATISVEGVNFKMITWVSNGNVIRRETDFFDPTAVLDVLVFRLSPIVWIFRYFGLGYNPVERLVKPY